MFQVRAHCELKADYDILCQQANRGNKEAKKLRKLYDKGFEKISQDIRCGQKKSRKLWPEYYQRKYGIDNLWVLDLSDFWRMIYTIVYELELIGNVLEVLDHNEYDKRFGCK